MAYSVMDVVARESIRFGEWRKPSAPRGRPPSGKAMGVAERQRAFKMRKNQALGPAEVIGKTSSASSHPVQTSTQSSILQAITRTN